MIATLSPVFARGSGNNPKREQLVLKISLAIVVAVSIKIVGALRKTAMLIFPSATARPFSRTPEAMAVGAPLFGITAVVLAPIVSYQLDTPTGPTIVSTAALFIALSYASDLCGE